MSTPRLVVGCMSGTSMDGIDAALVSISGEGLSMAVTVVRGASAPLPHAERLRAFAEGAAVTARELHAMSLDLGSAHAALLADLLQGDRPDLIVMHGQTVLHEPPLSWQLLNPWPVAVALSARVVTDLRSRSVFSGGQGAPLTPLADWILFRSPSEPRAVLNLGGFANLTRLPVEGSNASADLAGIRGEDIGPCNLVLDRLARDRLGKPFDAEGRSAESGRVCSNTASRIAAELSTRGNRSMGTGDEAPWVVDATASLPAADAVATACDAIARVICGRVEVATLVVAGGGTRNRGLMRGLERHHSGRVFESDVLGVPTQLREAAGFAVLGALADDGVPVSLAQVTEAATVGRDGQWILP